MSEIKITARHINITGEIKEHIMLKLDSLSKLSSRISRIEVIIDNVRNLFNIEAIISILGKPKIITKVSHFNYLSALDIIVDKLEIQLTKLKEKRKGKRNAKFGISSKKASSFGSDLEDWF